MQNVLPRRRWVALAASLVLILGVGVPSAESHGSSAECTGEILPEDVRSATPTECIFHFTGFPILVEGYFFTDHPELKSDIHVVVTAVTDDGRKQELPVECVDLGRVGDPMAKCRYEWNPLGNGRQPAEIPMLHDVHYLLCEAHTHARESRLHQRFFGAKAGGEFRCATAPWDASPGGSVPEVEAPGAPAGAPAFAAVPVNTYATAASAVSRDVAGSSPPSFLNLDQNLHDVVALDARRADGSAPWCFQYDSGACPLFWSELIGQGETTPVLGFADTPPGAYRFYCSIHPEMIGTVEVR